jgi:RimJ/RimL family protein N-acetyltransferase
VELTSQRTKLRRLRPNDLAHMIALETDADVMKFTPSRFPLTHERIEERLRGMIEKEAERAPLGIWVAELKDTGEFVGWFMLIKTELEFPELGFMTVRKQWGKGLTTEVAKAVMSYGLNDLGYSGISAATDPGHTVSIAVLKKLGFSHVRTEPHFDKVLGRETGKSIFEHRR